MKKSVLFVTLAMAFILFTVPAWSYTSYVGSAIWGYPNHGGNVYDSSGTLWSGDDFNGIAGGTLSSPPYVHFNNNIVLNGGGSVALTAPNYSPGDTHVELPNYSSSGNWLSVNYGRLGVNFQNGPPEAGYGFGIEIKSSDQNGNIVDTAQFEAITFKNSSAGLLRRGSRWFTLSVQIHLFASIGWLHFHRFGISCGWSGKCIRLLYAQSNR
jgi:hypothetical protein